MTVRSQGFYVTLPSNASLNVFKTNTSSCFRVDLAQHLNLDGAWEVALTEISYPYTWLNLPNDKAYFECRRKGDAEQRSDNVVKTKIRAGFYEDAETLRTEIEACLRRIGSDIYLKYHPIVKKFEFTAGGIYQLRFFPPLAYMLGVPAGVWQRFERKFAPYPSDIKAGCYHLFCYSDIAALQLVGDSYSPLLRTVKIEGNYGDIVTLSFNKPDYIPVARRQIENIHIEIKTDQNEPVNFTYGKTIVKLHFRPVKDLA